MKTLAISSIVLISSLVGISRLPKIPFLPEEDLGVEAIKAGWKVEDAQDRLKLEVINDGYPELVK